MCRERLFDRAIKFDFRIVRAVRFCCGMPLCIGAYPLRYRFTVAPSLRRRYSIARRRYTIAASLSVNHCAVTALSPGHSGIVGAVRCVNFKRKNA